MRRANIMVVAGDPSGDTNAADLVRALAKAVPDSEFQATRDSQPLTVPLAPSFFGAGGPKMAAAGVELAFDLTAQSAIGLDFLTKLPRTIRQLNEMFRLAVERQPEVIVLVDYGGFNLRLARTIKRYVRSRSGAFFNWNPKIVQFTSPQLWASRPWRAHAIAKDCDLLLALFPFEKKWYAERVPKLNVEFVGNTVLDRFTSRAAAGVPPASQPPVIVLLPGSRRAELKRHLPVMLEASRRIASKQAVAFKMVLRDEADAGIARKFLADSQSGIGVQVAGVDAALAGATLAIAKSGTITLECAYFGVPSVVIYKVAPYFYALARPLVTVKYLSMPNLLAGEAIYPEFIQGRATARNLADSALELLSNPGKREEVRAKLGKVIESLGGPGAARRAAAAIVNLMRPG